LNQTGVFMLDWWVQLLEKIASAKNIGILTHKDPDGDGLAAAIALQSYLLWKNYKSEIILEEPAPQIYRYLKADELTRVWNSDLTFDFLIILDCHEPSRLGVCSELLKDARIVFVADHHEKRDTIPHATNWIDSHAVSVGIMIHHCIYTEMLIAPPDVKKFYANAIYTSILNDTDNFVNSNTDITAYQTVVELMPLGLKPNEVANEFLFNKPALELKFIGEVLSTIEIHESGKVLFLDSTLDMLQRNGLDQSATTKLTRWVKGVAGVEVVVYFREIESKLYRLSLRSVHTPVNKIAELYGGGGHKVAAGCAIDGTLAEVKQIILNHLNIL
jgi:bifunctional oligoribonuclease and PAP phosphatase NrnA